MKPRHRFAPLVGLFVSILWSSAALSQCTAPATWFPHSQTPKPDDTIAPNSNCAFHQWAWHEFLWLTQPVGQGQLRFMSMPTASDLFDTGTTPPVAANSLPKGRMLVLKPRTIQTQGPTSLGDILQANSRGILVDQKGRSVYYASAINDVFFDFVRTNNLFTMAGYDAASPTLNFPVGSLELKSSWMVGDTDADVEAARAVGCATIIVLHPGSAHKRTGSADATHCAADLDRKSVV